MIQKMTQSGKVSGVISVDLTSADFEAFRAGGYAITFNALFGCLGPWIDGQAMEVSVFIKVSACVSSGAFSLEVTKVTTEGEEYEGATFKHYPEVATWAVAAVAGLGPEAFGYAADPRKELRSLLSELAE